MDAQYNLALMYDMGRGVPVEHTEAVRWYRQAAEQGDAFSQCNLGIKYANGEGVEQNDAAAFHWMRLAAEQGDGKAQRILGEMYEDGFGVTPDHVTAYMWYCLAEKHGEEEARNARQNLSTSLSTEQKAEAQWRAAQCKPKPTDPDDYV